MQRALPRAGCTPTCSEYSAELPLPPALYGRGVYDEDRGPSARESLHPGFNYEYSRNQGTRAPGLRSVKAWAGAPFN